MIQIIISHILYEAKLITIYIGNKAVAKVKHILPKGAICSVRQKDLLWWPPHEHANNDEIAI